MYLVNQYIFPTGYIGSVLAILRCKPDIRKRNISATEYAYLLEISGPSTIDSSRVVNIAYGLNQKISLTKEPFNYRTFSYSITP